jgi:hypothetical protein
MQFRIEVIVIADDGTECRQEVVTLTRTEVKLETIGLTLTESKQVLQQLQQTVIEQQVDAYLDEQRACPACGKRRPLKESDTAPFRTPFGRVEVRNPRWEQCACQPHPEKALRPLAALLPERTSPELRYLETKWASLAAYGLTTELLHEVLPIDQKYSANTVRNHTLRAATDVTTGVSRAAGYGLREKGVPVRALKVRPQRVQRERCSRWLWMMLVPCPACPLAGQAAFGHN